MKFSAVLSLILLTFLLPNSALGQTSARINFDLTPSGGFDGSTRSRIANGGSSTVVARALEREVFELINAERRKHNLGTLEWSESLASIARLHSQNMAREKFFSHRGSDGSMVDERADRMGLGSWRAIGENIAYMRGYDNPARLAVQKWLESTGHRMNLLGSNWKESAVGVAITSDGTHYFTEVFLVRN
jgi:uncharacterized protein YkwD